MKKKVLFPLVAGLLLASCGGPAPAESSNPAGSGSNPTSQGTSEEKPQIVLTADKSEIAIGDTVTVKSNVEGVTFSSQDTSVASVDDKGVVTGLRAGETKIIARKTGYKVGQLDLKVVKAAEKNVKATLELEDAEHYDPDDFWGMNYGGTVYGPGDTPVEENDYASGGKSIGWFNQGCKETLKFTSSKEVVVDLGISMAYNSELQLEGLITVSLNGVALDLTGKVCEGPSEEAAADQTWQYYDFNTVHFPNTKILSGENVLVIECVGSQGPNLDCVKIMTDEEVTCKTIPAPVLPKITVESASLSVEEGKTVAIKANVEGATYTSADATIATVDSAGVVTGVKEGRTTIEVSKEGYKPATVNVSVSAPLPASEYSWKLEYEDADHYHPDGVWGYPQWGMAYDTPVEENEQSSGGKSVGWLANGCKETLAFSATAAGKADLVFMMARNQDFPLEGNITIAVNGKALDVSGKVVEAGAGGSYYDYKPIVFKGVDVAKGDNTVVLEVVGQAGPNLDYLSILSSADLGIVAKAVVPVPTESIGTIDYFVNGYEWGPAIDGVALNLTAAASKAVLDAENFVVSTNGKARVVTDLYFIDANDEKVTADTGTRIYFALRVDYTSQGWQANDGGSGVFSYNFQTGRNSWKEPTAEIKIASGKSVTIGEKTYGTEVLGATKELGKKVIPDVKNWGAEKTNTDGERTLRYKAFETDELKNDGVKNALIVWLHGQGEGGEDVDIALLGNDVTNLGQEKIQSHFKTGDSKGAYVLAVQSPTMWMDDGTGQNNGGAAHSIYTALLKDTIDKYLASNADVDTSRIILGGCSNGGYMTMEMALTYPTFFKAYYPTCEAYQDAFITDEDINKLKGLSIWFTHAANDTTVNPANFTVATYKRLMAAGATDVHFSFFENVKGGEGRHDDGLNDYQGHYSWIYVLKDECLKDVESATEPAAPSTKDVLVNGKAAGLWAWAASK